jgi:hypothetical protein
MKRLSMVFLSVLVAAGCARATVTTTRPAEAGLSRPDRVIVHDFGVLAADEKQRDGQAVAKALTDHLIKTLRDHGINAVHVSATPLPGSTTASILGEVVRFPGGNEMGARIQVYQGAGRTARLVAEMKTSVKPDMRAPFLAAALEADARRTAEAVADRIGDYYRRQGWPWR